VKERIYLKQQQQQQQAQFNDYTRRLNEEVGRAMLDTRKMGDLPVGQSIQIRSMRPVTSRYGKRITILFSYTHLDLL